MKFIIETASNCSPDQLLMQNNIFKGVARQQGIQAVKKITSFFICACCCVDNPSSSLLIQKAELLGIPPKQLIKSEGSGQHFVISYVGNNANGIEEKTPLLFMNDQNIAKAVMDELNQIYISSNQMTAIFPNGATLEELDGQAKIWNQLFGLPAYSKGTQELQFNSGFIESGLSIIEYAAQHPKALPNVRSLFEEVPQHLVNAI